MASRFSAAGKVPKERQKSQLVAIFVATGLGITLISLAAPRFVASLLVLASPPVADAAEAGQYDTSALDWAQSLVNETTSAGMRAQAFHTTLARSRVTDIGRSEALGRAMTATEELLRISPAQPAAWLQLASLRDIAGDRVGAAAALRLSILSGPFVPELMASRLMLAGRLLDDLGPETLPLAYRQVRLVQAHLPEHYASLSQHSEMTNLLFLATNAPERQGKADYRASW